MENAVQPLVDSHVHLDLIEKADPGRIDWLRAKHFVVISWAFGQHIDSAADLDAYLQAQRSTIDRIACAEKLNCFFLTGVHPRNIPADLDPATIPEMLLPHLEHKRCLGIGEIGLETGGFREQVVFKAQLDLARRLEKPWLRIGVHTPRRDKTAVTRQILAILKAYEDLRSMIVVDHCTPDTVGTVLAAGYRAGITLSPPKTSLADLVQILAVHPAGLDRILCNTDSGESSYDDLLSAARSGKIAPAVQAKIFRGNAAAFFGLPL